MVPTAATDSAINPSTYDAVCRARVQYPRTRCCASMSQPVPAQSTLRRQVVTAFVQRPSDAAVLLVLRSDKVNT